MNKELIKTYFEEFKHWLSGGNVQVYYKKDDEPKWLTDEECIEYEGHDNFSHIMQNSLEPDDILIVIDDIYSDYRKALAEGKTVEVAVDHSEKDGYTWKSIEDEEFHHFNIEEIRIKPDVPKFKVGDWVVHNGVIKQVTKAVDGLIDSLDNQVAVIMKEESLELWEPKEGEWCIIYDTDEEPYANSITLQKWYDRCKWTPIPFIGKLPPYIKDSDES